jgi:hypothetical protein
MYSLSFFSFLVGMILEIMNTNIYNLGLNIFFVLEFQFISQIVPQFWKNNKLVLQLSFSSKT